MVFSSRGFQIQALGCDKYQILHFFFGNITFNFHIMPLYITKSHMCFLPTFPYVANINNRKGRNEAKD